MLDNGKIKIKIIMISSYLVGGSVRGGDKFTNFMSSVLHFQYVIWLLGLTIWNNLMRNDVISGSCADVSFFLGGGGEGVVRNILICFYSYQRSNSSSFMHCNTPHYRLWINLLIEVGQPNVLWPNLEISPFYHTSICFLQNVMFQI